MFLFRPRVSKYRQDGINWRRRDDNKLREGREKLKVNGVEVLRCFYVQAEDNTHFHRRTYSLLNSLDPTVLVHYLDQHLSALASAALPLQDAPLSSHGADSCHNTPPNSALSGWFSLAATTNYIRSLITNCVVPPWLS